MQEEFQEEYDILNENKELHDKVKQYLINEGINPQLKGFDYFADLVTISLFKKKYSMSFMKTIYPFIAHKYNIKKSSVQRQLRYTFTLKNVRKVLPEDMYKKIWLEFKGLEERKEENE